MVVFPSGWTFSMSMTFAKSIPQERTIVQPTTPPNQVQ